MELLAYWRIIRARKWLIIGLMVLGTIGAVVFSLRQTPQYSASTTLFLNPAVAEPLLGFQNADSVQSLADTYAEFTRTRSFAEHVAAESGIAVTPKLLEQMLFTSYVPDTQFFSITVVWPDAKDAQTLANTAATVLLDANAAWQQAKQQLGTSSAPTGQASQDAANLADARRTQVALYDAELAQLQAQLAAFQQQPPSDERDERVAQARERISSVVAARVDALESLVRTGTDAATDRTAAAVSTSIALVVDPAVMPVAPLPRNMLRTVAVAIIMSLVLGLGSIFLLEYLNQSIAMPEALDALYGMPTLGVVSRTRQRCNRPPLSAVPAALEAFRVLQVNLHAAANGAPLRSVLVTSAVPNEGKTWIAVHLAISMAQTGRSVIVVDANLHHPSLHAVFAVRPEPGLGNLLARPHDDMLALLQQTATPNLWVLPCGALDHAEGALLHVERVASVAQQLAALADLVIYDAPALLGLSDALAIAPHTDGVIQVVRADKTSAEAVLRGKGALERVRTRIIGPVLNAVAPAIAHATLPYPVPSGPPALPKDISNQAADPEPLGRTLAAPRDS